MLQTIWASFQSVDMAAHAASEIRSRFSDIKQIDMQYHERDNKKNSFIAAITPNAFATADMGSPVMQNGIFPTVMAAPVMGTKREDEWSEAHKGAVLEVIANISDKENVCSVLHQAGGTGIKVMNGGASRIKKQH